MQRSNEQASAEPRSLQIIEKSLQKNRYRPMRRRIVPVTPAHLQVESDGFFGTFRGERRFDDREREHRFAYRSECPLLAEPLENFLNHGAGDDLIERDVIFEREIGSLPEDLDPDGRVNEDHTLFSPAFANRDASRSGFPPRGRIRRDREFVAR